MSGIIISVAHSEKSPGAEIPDLGLTEYAIAIDQGIIAANDIRKAGYDCELFECSGLHDYEYVKVKPEYINKNGPFALAIEIHHNAIANSDANYLVASHYPYADNARHPWGKLAAELITDELAQVVPWENKGAKPYTWFGNNRHAWFCGPGIAWPSLLIEAGFFTGKGAKEFYSNFENIENEGHAIGRGAVRYIQERQKYYDRLRNDGSA